MNQQGFNDNLNICMLNCNSITNKLGEIKNFMVNIKPDIFCLSETWLTKYIPKFRNYICHWKNRNNHGGGLGILVSAGVSHRDLPLAPFAGGFLEVQAISVDSGRSGLSILNVYNPNKNISVAELEHYIDQLGSSFLLMGDLNAHTPILCQRDINSNGTGKTLEHLIGNQNICLNNPYNFFTYLDRRSGSQSCLDICLSSPSLSPHISMNLQEDLGSDHKTVQMWLKYDYTKVLNKKIPKWIITDKGLKEFNCNYIERKIIYPTDINTLAKDLTKRISDSPDQVFGLPSSSITSRVCTKRTPWWNDKCYEAVKNRRKAQHLAEKHPTTENLLSLRKLSAKARNVCTNAKRDSLHEYISGLKPDTPQSQVWNKIRNFKSVYTRPDYPITENNNPILTPHDKGNSFASHFQRVRNIPNVENSLLNVVNAETKQKTNNLGQSISSIELQSATRSLKNNSPGPDCIPNQLIKALNGCYLDDILVIFNQSISSGVIPSDWKIGHVIPILKPGKNPERCESYRPICLLSCLGKLLEKIICKRLEHFMESHNCFLNCQSGFRPSRSTLDVLHLVENTIKNSFASKLYTAVVYIDLKGAFDCVWHIGLLYKLCKIGVTGSILLWLQNYLSDRKIQVRVSGFLSSEVSMDCGVPQGATLSALSFNVMMSDFPSSNYATNLIFADDVTVVSTNKDPAVVQQNLQYHMDAICDWAKKWGFIINNDKTKVQHFTKRFVPPPVLSMDGAIIEYCKEHRLLGLIFDSPRLTWSAHVRHLQMDCVRRLNIMKCFSSVNFGACFKVLNLFYIAYVRSKITYGASVFGSLS